MREQKIDGREQRREHGRNLATTFDSCPILCSSIIGCRGANEHLKTGRIKLGSSSDPLRAFY
jgi:hypothetical protein